jgi:translation initiation factor 4G
MLEIYVAWRLYFNNIRNCCVIFDPQARHESFRSAPPLPTPSAPKQQLPRKDAGAVNQPNTGEAYPVPKAKKDAQVSPAPPVSQQQKPPGLPMTGMSMPMPFHQSQVSVQYGGPNQQLQSQGMTAAPSLQMPMHMPLAMGNPSQVQPSVFVPGLQPHPMQTQGIIHQGQGMSFTTQMGPPQLPPQLSSIGITMSPQYPPQQGGKFGQRKTTVKITHPDTHEELRLDKRADSYSDGGSSGPRSHPNVAPQSQPIPSYAPPHSLSFYSPNSYNASPIYYPPQGSVPLTSSQMAPSTQAPRFNYQVGQGPQNMTYMNPALSSLPVNKTGTQMHGVADLPNLEHSRDVNTIISSAPSTTIPVTVKPSAGSIGEKVADSMRPNSSHGVEKSESPIHVVPSGEASSTHPRRDSEICSESSLQQSKHGTESLVSKLLPVVTKQSAVSAVVSSEALLSNTLSSASVSPSEESTVVVPNNEGRRRDILGRSNSMKDHQKKTGKKGHIQSQHQVLLWCITLSFNHFSILFSPFSLIFMQKFTLFYRLALNLLQPQICILGL